MYFRNLFYLNWSDDAVMLIVVLSIISRSASPHHGFTIMNRLSTENLVEPINKDLEFQLQDPFLLYRTGNCK